MSWVPLHLHSPYSILDALGSIKEIVKKAKEYNLSSLALTDHGNLFGAVEFYKACRLEEIKPIIGCDFYVAPTTRHEKSKLFGHKAAYGLVLLAKDKKGYQNLCKLVSLGYTEGFYYFPRIDRDLIEKHHEGLICLSGGLNSYLAHLVINNADEKLQKEALWYKSLFGDDFYFELQRPLMTEAEIQEDGMHQESWLIQNYKEYIQKQTVFNKKLISLSKELDLQFVATNDSHYLERKDWKAHEILLNVQSGEPCEIWEKDSLGNLKRKIANPKRRTYASHSYNFKSPEEMAELFKDLPLAIKTTEEISKKCNLEIDFQEKHYPVFIPPELEGKEFTENTRQEKSESFLLELCELGINKRYTKDNLIKVNEVYPNKDPMVVVKNRLKMELEIICSKGMCDYILIVYDFINWAKNNSIPVGPGRGSGAGSIVLYLTEITDIEPLRFNLFFERFINPERLSYPDIDVDICMEKRGRVIDYTLKKYGKKNVAQIITFGTMKAKMSIKDIGRVLSVPLKKVNEIAKLIPEDPNMTLNKALSIDPDLFQMYKEDEDAKRIIDFGEILEGSVRNIGVHAAGVVVCGEELTNHIPICVAKGSEMPVTQYSMKPLEMVGMLKMDFLGLKTLTCIQKAAEFVSEKTKKTLDWVSIPLDDNNSFQLLNQGKTLGVFQLESSGMADLARKLHIDKFEEVIAVIALYRPGPMDMIPSFINRKHGREKITIDHPWMEEILEETYGVMVYQEQVMQIASKLANFSLGEGDVLRRAMGKKDVEEMKRQREKFNRGAKKNGIDSKTSALIFDKMEKFASYGFNKSHAAAYAYLSYVTAYFKANHPKEWMAALMTCDSDDISKVAKFIRECQEMQIAILPPDVNEVGKVFKATDKGIRFAMTAIKGVGEGVVDAIIKELNKNGGFVSLYDFVSRINSKAVGKKTIEYLIDAGCFDFTEWTRDQLKLSLDSSFDGILKERKEKDSGVLSLFSLLEEKEDDRFSSPPKIENPTLKSEIFLREKELLGFFLTGHPMNEYEKEMASLSCLPLSKISSLESGTVFRTSFIIETVKVRISSLTQKKIAILTISDGIDRFELPIWAQLYANKSSLIVENQLVFAVLQIEKSDDICKLNCHWLEDLSICKGEMIQKCDQEFDRIKSMCKFRKRRTQKKSKESSEAAKPNEILSVALDIKALKMSHILKIKQIFRTFSGEIPVEISFLHDELLIGKISIASSWGVETNQTLLRLLSEIPSYKLSEKLEIR